MLIINKIIGNLSRVVSKGEKEPNGNFKLKKYYTMYVVIWQGTTEKNHTKRYRRKSNKLKWNPKTCLNDPKEGRKGGKEERKKRWNKNNKNIHLNKILMITVLH